MKAYLINLDSAEDRLAQFDAQARSLGFAYERIPAVDGRTPAYAESLGTRSAGPIRRRVLAPVEVACFDSHRAVWRAIVDSGDSHGIVLEDDVILKSGFERYVAPGWAPPEADIIRLESWRKPLHLKRAPAGKAHGRALHRLASNTTGAAAYALSAACARRLLERTTLRDDPVDVVLFYAKSLISKDLVIYQMTPAPARQAQFLADYQGQDFAKSALSGARGQPVQLNDMTDNAPWWRPFPELPVTTFTEFRKLAFWIAKERAKSVVKGTRFMIVPFS